MRDLAPSIAHVPRPEPNLSKTYSRTASGRRGWDGPADVLAEFFDDLATLIGEYRNGALKYIFGRDKPASLNGSARISLT